MNNVELSKYQLERAAVVPNVQETQALALCAIGHALLAIQEELVKEDKVLPSLPPLESLARDCGVKFKLTTETHVAKDEIIDDNEVVDNTPWLPPLGPVGTSKEPMWFGDASVVNKEEETNHSEEATITQEEIEEVSRTLRLIQKSKDTGNKWTFKDIKATLNVYGIDVQRAITLFEKKHLSVSDVKPLIDAASQEMPKTFAAIQEVWDWINNTLADKEEEKLDGFEFS